MTVQFVDSLPVGLDDVEWQIASPEDGIKSRLEGLLHGNELFIDLELYLNTKREEQLVSLRALIRVVPDLVSGVNRGESEESVFVLSNARAFFLDCDGRETDNIVKLKMIITTDYVAPGLSAGSVTMWPLGNEEYHIATAS